VVVWGIGSQDSLGALQTFTEQMGLTYPVLYDENGEKKQMYNPGKTPTNSVYPQDWIVGADGTIVYVNTEYEPDEMAQVLDAELEKILQSRGK